MTAIQFGMNLREIGSRQEFHRLVLRLDELGFDVFAAPDHLGAAAPFGVLAAAGVLSDRLRLRTYVLNIGFWNPALLAREVATVDRLSGGRAELGLGAGHKKAEHDAAGLPWYPHAERITRLQATLDEVRTRLADPGHEPKPVQQPIPLMVAAMSGTGLSTAAKHADIVGFAGLKQRKGGQQGELTFASVAETEQRVADVRAEAGDRPYRSDVLIQRVTLDPEPERVATELAEQLPGTTPEVLLESPFMLLAKDADTAATELHRRHEVYGFDSVTTHQPSYEALGEVIAAYRS